MGVIEISGSISKKFAGILLINWKVTSNERVPEVSIIHFFSFYLEASSLTPFSLFYDLIASCYTKRKWQWRQGYLSCFNHIILIRKCFFTSAYFSLFNLLIRSWSLWRKTLEENWWKIQIKLVEKTTKISTNLVFILKVH